MRAFLQRRIPVHVVVTAAVMVGISLAVSACGADTLGVATTVVPVQPTNFATIPPVSSTLPGTTTTYPLNAVGSEQSYTVVANDSPIAVANRYGISVTALLAYNGWVSPSQFPYPGQIVKIPPQAIAPIDTPATVDPATGGTTPAVSTDPTLTKCGTRPAGTYVVAKGDSVFTIRRKFCVSTAALLAANNWTDTGALLLVGDTINIPSAGA